MTTLYTIGHSTHPLEEFLAILKAHGITQLIDIRSIPKSRRMPWFNKEALAKSLEQHQIVYHHLHELGGRRKALVDSINLGWKHEGFRGYADYMQTKEFFVGLKNLHAYIKASKRTAIMCAEALPWRCHRSLVADALLARGVKVLDIFSKTNIKEHQMTSFAVVDKNTRPIRVYYPGMNYELL